MDVIYVVVRVGRRRKMEGGKERKSVISLETTQWITKEGAKEKGTINQEEKVVDALGGGGGEEEERIKGHRAIPTDGHLPTLGHAVILGLSHIRMLGTSGSS
jgi:hypothetical protein